MEESSQINKMLDERAALLDEASRIVATASAEGRDLTATEDSHVLRLTKRAQTLDEEVARLRRHHGEHGRV
jgi:SpoVK/Ycf46/Vps4 family AAA+-type ATPase